MKEVLVISGKGGTGKTTVTAALADLASKGKRLVLVDADVDAANLELLLSPEKKAVFPFMGGQIAEINQAECTQCGRCAEICRFDAIHPGNEFKIDEQKCEGCLACYYQCPTQAINIQIHQSGEWYRSETQFGELFHAFLYPGEENSGKLVTELKQKAFQQARKSAADILLIDGPPGIGCPVTAACRGADLVILVSEPSISGQHDLYRILAVTRHFNIPACLLINKADLNPKIRAEMLIFATQTGMPVLGEIMYDESLISAISQAKPATQVLDNQATDALKSICLKLEPLLQVN